MPAREIKIALKEIREAIKNKEIATAIRKCDEVLLEDPKNYMALVLMGAAHQENNKKEAAKYLRRAIENAPDDPTIALQGLANCAEIDEMPDIYEKLLKLLPDKSLDFHLRIVNAASKSTNLEKCILILENETKMENKNGNVERTNSAYTNLAKLLIKLIDIPENFQYLVIPSLEMAIKDESNQEVNFECFRRYLKQLYKIQDYENLLKNACVMTEKYPKEITPLEWICKVCSENQHTIYDEYLNDSLDKYVEKLLNLSPGSVSGITTKAMIFYKNKNYVMTRDLLTQLKSKSKIALELLAKTNMKLGSFKIAENIYVQLNKLDYDFVTCLSHSENEEHLKQAVEILNEKGRNSENIIEILECYGRCYYKLGNKKLLMDIYNEIKSLNINEAILFEAEFLLFADESIILTLENISNNDFKAEFLKGKIYLELKQYEKSLICLLKATKLKPYKSQCFFKLGLLYKINNDIVRARKCFEKCVNLNPLCEPAVSNLCAIYRKNQEWELNSILLDNLIQQLEGSSQKFVLFQQGLNYMGLEKFDDAIHAFRSAIRYDIKNIIFWENLADSYQERGSYQSAMRVYNKILELSPKNFYAKLQIGILKTFLRMYSEAIETFENLLEESPNYLPALKGKADAHYGLACHLMSQRLIGKAKDNFQYALDCLQRVFMIEKRNMIWLWRLIANIFTSVATLYPTSKSNLKVMGKLAGLNQETVTLNKKELFNFSIKYYTYAIKLSQEDSFLWQELSVCAYYYAIMSDQCDSHVNKYLQLAKNACKTSIKYQSNRWQTWNLLGVLYATETKSSKPNYALAQHYFITSLNVEKHIAVTWTNLGVLYLKVDEIKLANQAFIKAQQADPTYVNCWIGQAILAERISEEDEAMDLFRHCTELDFHVESSIGYARWVIPVIMDDNKMKLSHYKYVIENMYAITRALDVMNWYVEVENDKCSVESLAYYGYLNAKQGLWTTAIKSYSLASKKAEQKEKDQMLFNLGFCYLMQKNSSMAIETFNSIKEATLKSSFGLALAYTNDKKYEEAYQVYNSALEWLAETEKEKAEILTVMAAMVYLFQGESDTKTLLYQCLALEERPIEALFSALSIGIVHKDVQLSETVLEELDKFKDNPKYCHNIAFLTSQFYILKRCTKKAFMHLLSKVHIYPDNKLLRKVLSDFIINNYQTTKKYALGACQVAESVLIIGHRSSTRNNCNEDAKCLLTASEIIGNIDKKKQKKFIEKAVHLNPALPECRMALKRIM